MKIEWKQCLRIGISLFVLFLCIRYWDLAVGLISMILGAAVPIVVGCVIAFLLNILMSWYERHYFVKSADKKLVRMTRRPVCMIAAILTMIGIIALIVRLIIPELVSCFKLIMAEIPPLVGRLAKNEYINALVSEEFLSELASLDWQSYVEKFAKAFTSGIGGALSTVASVISSAFSVIVSTLLSIIFAIYILLSKDKLKSQAQRVMNHYVSEKWRKKILYLVSVFNDCFHKYIVGQCVEAVILGVLCTVGMSIFRFPYAMMIGVLIGFTALIPVAGAYIGAGVGAFMILTVSPFKALLFIIFIVVLQQLEGNLIYPRVVGSSLGLPGLWVLVAVTVGGGLFGIAGMLIGVPLVAAIYRIVKEDMHRRDLQVARADIQKEEQIE